MLAFKGAWAKELVSAWNLVSLLNIPSIVQDENSWSVVNELFPPPLSTANLHLYGRLVGVPPFIMYWMWGMGSLAQESKPNKLETENALWRPDYCVNLEDFGHFFSAFLLPGTKPFINGVCCGSGWVPFMVHCSCKALLQRS